MQMFQQQVVKIGLLIGCLLYSLDANAVIINAASCSRSDVGTAVKAASAGDTVVIPACPGTIWSSTLTIDKGITLQGAGTTSGASLTQINSGGVSPLVSISGLTSDVPVRITGIFFDLLINTGSDNSAVSIQGKNFNGIGTALTQIRLDHLKINKGSRQVNVHGWAYGVIDHNEFVNGDVAIGFAGDDNFSWGRAIAAGTANAMFIEDNTFTMNDSANVSLNEQIYHQEGARTVTRYNTFDGTARSADDSVIFDSHGNQNRYTGNTNSDFRGQPIIEFYNNTVAVHHTYRFCNLRGGSVLFHDNTFSTIVGGSPSVMAMTEEEDWQAQFFNPLDTVWPAEDQIMNSFFWNNTYNNSAIHPNLGHVEDSIFIRKDRDYFLHAPDASGGKLSYPTRPGASNYSTLSPGPNAYYPYTPYIYPHPLTTGTVVSNPPPAPPENLRVQ